MRLQKKSYRALEEICSSASKSTQEFVVDHMNDLQETLLKTLTTASSVSKAVKHHSVIIRFSHTNSKFFPPMHTGSK